MEFHDFDFDWDERLPMQSMLEPGDLIERFMLHHDLVGIDAPETVEVDTPAGLVYLPDEVIAFVPEKYEHRYAYPLVVWVAANEAEKQRLLDRMPSVSTRNYLGTAVVVDEKTDDDSKRTPDLMSLASTPRLPERIRETVRQLRQEYNIHTERIYLAGAGDSAIPALSVLLERPEWFAGAILYCDKITHAPRSLKNFRELEDDKRILLATGSNSPNFSLTKFVGLGRLMHSAGLSVTPKVFDAGAKLPKQFGREIDEWLMAGICAV